MALEVYTIPTGASPDKIYTVLLDNLRYDLRIQYLQRLGNVSSEVNSRADEYMIHIALSGEDPFISTSLKTNRDILEPYRYRANCPKGSLLLVDNTAMEAREVGKNYNPERVTYEGLGDRWTLVYVVDE